MLYVDDLLIVTGDIQTMNAFKQYLMTQFNMVDLQECKLFLGIMIHRTKDNITLDQSSYLKTVLNKYNMQNCNTIKICLPEKLDYVALNSDEYYDAPSKNLIGCLMYTMLCTRPDLLTF